MSLIRRRGNPLPSLNKNIFQGPFSSDDLLPSSSVFEIFSDRSTLLHSPKRLKRTSLTFSSPSNSGRANESTISWKFFLSCHFSRSFHFPFRILNPSSLSACCFLA